MSYLVIARKFRPQSFASVIGQEHITKALANAILWNRVPHALLFTGPRGVGKTTSARVLAKALNCTGRKIPDKSSLENNPDVASLIDPCGSCTNCQEITKSNSLAVWEIDGASNNSVENVRELIDSLYSVPPPGSKYKIYIIDEVHMLSTAAFNALLKSLEEPPTNTIFIFATTEPHKIPETVISRCQRHDFKRIPTAVIASSLEQIAKNEAISAEEGVFEFVARKAQGGMRDAQSLLDRLISFSGNKIELSTAQQILGSVDTAYYLQLSAAILNKNVSACFNLINLAFTQSLDTKTFIADFISHFRKLLVLSFLFEKNKNLEANKEILELLEITKPEFTELSQQLKNTTSFDCQRLFDLALETTQTVLSCNFPRFALEAGIAKMASLEDLMPLGEIISNLKSNNSNITNKATPAKQVNTTLELNKVVNTTELPSNGTNFNPSWQDFVHHVQTVRKEVLLSTLLKRSFASVFLENKLVLEASEFDIKTLKDQDIFQSLNSCLESYSGHSNWNINLLLQQKSNTNNQAIPLAKKIEKQITPPSVVHPNSISAQETQAEITRVNNIEKEAINSPMVKNVLETFGARIEKVSVTKK